MSVEPTKPRNKIVTFSVGASERELLVQLGVAELLVRTEFLVSGALCVTLFNGVGSVRLIAAATAVISRPDDCSISHSDVLFHARVFHITLGCSTSRSSILFTSAVR